MTEGIIRTVLPGDAKELTRIAFAAKGFWNYPESYLERWEEELTLTGDYIRNNRVFCWQQENRIYGFYSLVKVDKEQQIESLIVEKGLWLDHMFIDPPFHQRGIGRAFFNHLKTIISGDGFDELRIFCDPHACGFYEKMGARLIRQSPSTIPGRSIPVYLYQI